MALNLEKQLIFYGAYHHDSVNVAIHMVCVPLLLFTGIILACTVRPLFTVPEPLSVEYLPANFGTIGAFMYTFIYILLEPVAGISYAPLVIGSAVYGNYLHAQHGVVVNYYAGIIHLISWIAQFVGHGHFEGRAPALLDNLVQAVLLAPLFVWMKILFFFGYRPELKKRMNEQVEIEVTKFRNERALKKGKST